MVWQIAAAAGIGALGSVFGANESADAASDAARAQTDAANQSLQLQEQIYNDQRQLQQPYYQAGLQALYGPTGLTNLLGITQPGGSAPQPANNSQPANAFADYASGSYGVQTPAQQESDKWSAYLAANPDVLQHYTEQNMANSPHLLRGAGKGADLDGNGVISPEEFAQKHYQDNGRAEGRSFGDYGKTAVPQNAFTAEAAPVVTQPVTAAEAQPATAADPSQGSMTQTLRQTPGYQFLLDESERQLENSFASRGKLLSGAAMNALNERTLGLADQTYQSSVNNQFNLANLGMGSAAQINNSATNFGNAASNAFYNQGNAAANGAYGQANAFNQGLQGVTDSIGWGVGAYGQKQGWFS